MLSGGAGDLVRVGLADGLGGARFRGGMAWRGVAWRGVAWGLRGNYGASGVLVRRIEKSVYFDVCN
jgi:hypothetical protein